MDKEHDPYSMLRITSVRGMKIGDNKLLHLANSKLEHLYPHSKDHLLGLKAIMEEYVSTVVYLVICQRIVQHG